MYSKLMQKILDSSVWLENEPTRLVWITFLAAMDQDGFVALSAVGNVAMRARVSLEAAIEAVRILESPDQHDPTQEYEGRRIERVPYGWMVLNSGKYRVIARADKERETTRIRVERYRAKKRGVTVCNETVTLSDARSDADADANADAREWIVRAPLRRRPEHLSLASHCTVSGHTFIKTALSFHLTEAEAADEWERWGDYEYPAGKGKVDWAAAWRTWLRSPYRQSNPQDREAMREAAKEARKKAERARMREECLVLDAEMKRRMEAKNAGSV